MMSKHATAGSETPSGRATRCISPKPAKQTCRNGRVEVVTTEATKPDGEAMEDIHEQLAQHDLLLDNIWWAVAMFILRRWGAGEGAIRSTYLARWHGDLPRGNVLIMICSSLIGRTNGCGCRW